MKKTLLLTLSICLLALLFAGCQCQHEWKDATCDAPKTCTLCKETEGAPLGHVWNAATCDAPKTCSVCRMTEGKALGHDWKDATCETPKTCANCKETDGEALGHSWLDATTESPKTCETCSKTEGSKIETDSRFETGKCEHLFGTWAGSMTMDGSELLGIETNEELSVTVFYTFTFRNDGTMLTLIQYEEESYKHFTRYTSIEMIYEIYMMEGATREQAAAAFLAENGMTIEEAVDLQMESFDVEDFNIEEEQVWFAEAGYLYMDYEWSDVMEGQAYEQDGDKLTLHVEDIFQSFTLELTRQG